MHNGNVLHQSQCSRSQAVTFWAASTKTAHLKLKMTYDPHGMWVLLDELLKKKQQQPTCHLNISIYAVWFMNTAYCVFHTHTLTTFRTVEFSIFRLCSIDCISDCSNRPTMKMKFYVLIQTWLRNLDSLRIWVEWKWNQWLAVHRLFAIVLISSTESCYQCKCCVDYVFFSSVQFTFCLPYSSRGNCVKS